MGLDALSTIRDPSVALHFKTACGVEGHDKARRLFGVGAFEGEDTYHSIQDSAISAFGASHLPEAVPILRDIVMQTGRRFFANPRIETMRLVAANALVAHDSTDASNALEACLKSKVHGARNACKKALRALAVRRACQDAVVEPNDDDA